MTIYYELFEKSIRELPEKIKNLSSEETLAELEKAKQEIGKLFHAQNAEEAIARVKAQMWAYEQILGCYKKMYSAPKDSKPKDKTSIAKIADIGEVADWLVEEWAKVSPDAIAGESFYEDMQDEFKEIIRSAKEYAQPENNEKGTYRALAASLLKALDISKKMLDTLKNQYNSKQEELEKIKTEHEETRDAKDDILEEKTEIEQRIMDELG